MQENCSLSRRAHVTAVSYNWLQVGYTSHKVRQGRGYEEWGTNRLMEECPGEAPPPLVSDQVVCICRSIPQEMFQRRIKHVQRSKDARSLEGGSNRPPSTKDMLADMERRGWLAHKVYTFLLIIENRTVI